VPGAIFGSDLAVREGNVCDQFRRAAAPKLFAVNPRDKKLENACHCLGSRSAAKGINVAFTPARMRMEGSGPTC
jgi:hypothetical protein